MEILDASISVFVNSFVGSNPIIDKIALGVSSNYAIKGMFVSAIFWYLWFRKSASIFSKCQIVSILLVSVFAIFVGRFLATSLPFRLRPIHSPDIDINLIAGLERTILDGWSSFPSDHAVLFFAMATGIFALHRPLGVLALIHAAVIICLPRVYIGYHYFGDVLVGAIVGALLTTLLMNPLARVLEKSSVKNYLEVESPIFYAIFFCVTFQMATMFDSARQILKVIL